MLLKPVSVDIPFRRIAFTTYLDHLRTFDAVGVVGALLYSVIRPFGSLRGIETKTAQILREVLPAEMKTRWDGRVAETSSLARLGAIRSSTREYCDCLCRRAPGDSPNIRILERPRIWIGEHLFRPYRALVITPQAYHNTLSFFVTDDTFTFAVDYGNDPNPAIRADSWVVESSAVSIYEFLSLDPLCERQRRELWVDWDKAAVPFDISLLLHALPSDYYYPRPDLKRRSDPGGGSKVLCAVGH